MSKVQKRLALAVLSLVLIAAGAFGVLFLFGSRLLVSGSNLLAGSCLVPEKIANALSLGTLLATILYLLLTLAIAVIAVRELSHLESASRADFFLRLTREFFTTNAQRITELCASDCLTYVPAATTKDSYFAVDNDKIAATSKIEPERTMTSWSLDSFTWVPGSGLPTVSGFTSSSGCTWKIPQVSVRP